MEFFHKPRTHWHARLPLKVSILSLIISTKPTTHRAHGPQEQEGPSASTHHLCQCLISKRLKTLFGQDQLVRTLWSNPKKIWLPFIAGLEKRPQLDLNRNQHWRCSSQYSFQFPLPVASCQLGPALTVASQHGTSNGNPCHSRVAKNYKNEQHVAKRT